MNNLALNYQQPYTKNVIRLASRSNSFMGEAGKGIFQIVDYDPAWPIRAAAEVAMLTRQLSKYEWFKEVVHFGSTSIPNMPAKPIIDIMLGYDTLGGSVDYEDVEAVVRTLNHALGRFWICITKHKEKYWNYRLLFRDYFLKHPEEVNNYGNLKKTLIARGYSFGLYVRHKQCYFAEILKREGLTLEEMIDGGVIDDDNWRVKCGTAQNLFQ